MKTRWSQGKDYLFPFCVYANNSPEGTKGLAWKTVSVYVLDLELLTLRKKWSESFKYGHFTFQ